MGKYQGSFAPIEPEILRLHSLGKTPFQIAMAVWDRTYCGGHYYRRGSPSEGMIRYILRRNGRLSVSRVDPASLDRRITLNLQREQISLLRAQSMSDADLLRINNFGKGCLARFRQWDRDGRPQNPEYRFEHLSEAPIG